MKSKQYCWTARYSLFLLIVLVVFLEPALARDGEKNPAAADWADIAYKKAKILGGHAPPEETLALIKQLIELGQLQPARELLEKSPALPSHYHAQRLDAELGLKSAEYFNLAEHDPTKNSHKREIQKILTQLAREKGLDPGALARYEQQAEEFALGEAVVAFATQLAAAEPAKRSHWWAKAGEWSLGGQAPGQTTKDAIGYYHKAYAGAQGAAERHTYFIARLKALQVDGQQEKIGAEIAAARADIKDATTLDQLARISLQIERPDLAWRLYGQLVLTDPGRGSHWLAQTTRWALAAGQPLEAARFLQTLPTAALSAGARDDLLRQQITLLQHGDQPGAALALIEKILERTAGDAKLIEQAVQLALAAGKADRADKWNSVLLLLEPQNKQLLQRQADIALARNEPDKAVRATRQLFLGSPGDLRLEQQLAQLEEWTGNHRAALVHWQHLCTVEDQLGCQEQVYRLSRMVDEHRPALAALNRIAELRQLSEDELKGRIFLYEILDEPEKAAMHVAAYLEKYPWNYQNYDEKQFVTLEHLIYLQQKSGQREQALRFALHSAAETKDHRFLLLALKIAAASRDDEQVDSLLQKMQASPRSFAAEPQYWLIRAQRAYARGNYREAKKLYQRTLALDRESLTAREGILWSLLSTGDKEKLAAQLQAWQPQALAHRELWLVYALSQQFLGHYRLAAIWYERLLADGRQDYGIILGYADALEAAGAADRAYRLRMRAMGQLRAEAAAFLQQQGKLTETVKSYVALLQRYGSTQQGEYWLQHLQQLDKDHPPAPWIYELAISWYLNGKLPDQAKIWLAKAHEQRIQVPGWQEAMLALAEDNPQQLSAMLDRDSRLDRESNVAILAQLDRRREALRLAEATLEQEPGSAPRAAARMQAASLRQDFPAYWSMGYDTTSSDQLDSNEAHLSGRYSLRDHPLGYGLTYRLSDYSSSLYALEGHDSASDLAVSAYLGDGSHGGHATVGLNHHDADDIGYGYFAYLRQLTKEIITQLKLALHAVPEVDSILQPATLQNRLDATLSGTMAKDYYYYLDLWGREYTTRDNDNVAKGGGATTEIGLKQRWGRFEWLTGLQANFEGNSEREVPEELAAMLPEGYGVDEVVAEKATTVLVGGRIGRGEIREEYPSTASVRYFASAWLGPTWPQEELTVNLRAGSGVRMLGNDELSLEVHYNQAGGVVGRNDDSGVSVQYQYHY